MNANYRAPCSDTLRKTFKNPKYSKYSKTNEDDEETDDENEDSNQVDEIKTPLKLILDVSTRWNSTFMMIKRASMF